MKLLYKNALCIISTLGIILSSDLLFSQSRPYNVNDNLVREYLDEVYKTTEATKFASPSRHEFEEVVEPAIDVFQNNTYEAYQGKHVTNQELTHFIDEGRKNRQYESRFNCNSYDCYRQQYHVRHKHINGCHVCNKFTRLWFQYSNISAIPFYPPNAYYQGKPLNTKRDRVYFQNQSCPVYFDYHDQNWMFEYAGSGYHLSF